MSEVKVICNAHCFNATPNHSMKKNTTWSSKNESLKVFHISQHPLLQFPSMMYQSQFQTLLLIFSVLHRTMVQTDFEVPMEEIGLKTCITGYHHFRRLASR